MNQHLAASCTLSVALVVLFAIAFYQPERPAGLTRPGGPLPPPRANPLTGQAGRGTPVAPGPPSEAIAGRRVDPDRADPDARRASAPGLPRRPPPGRKPEFATVGPGETIADVATRVYGPGGSAQAVWRANRDQLPSSDTPLRAGMVLRTP